MPAHARAKNRTVRAATSAAPQISTPVFISGEDPGGYAELLEKVHEAVKPAGIVEEFWVQDIVDLAWQVYRLRRLRSALINASLCNGIEKILRSMGLTRAQSVTKEWQSGWPQARKAVAYELESAGLTMDSVAAETLSMRLDELERVERMIAEAENRRSSVLREIERHRSIIADRLRRATDLVEEADFAEVETAQLERQDGK